MTLAFLASRKGYLKVMGSLIQAALDRGHRVVLLRDPDQKKPGEATTDADFRAWPTAVRVDYRWGAPLGPALERHGVDALVGPSLYLLLTAMKRLDEARELKRRGLGLYSVDYGFETVTSDPEGYRIIDVTFYQSEFQRELHWSQPSYSSWKGDFSILRLEIDLAKRSAVCGSTMLDQVALVSDRDAIRRKHRVPVDRPLVLLMSLKMQVGDERKHIWGGAPNWIRLMLATLKGRSDLCDRIRAGNPYRSFMESVREFCRRNGAVLVVKSREKNRDPGFVRRRRAPDRFYVEKDDEVFPYTSIQLMAAADLCIHFQSGAVLEAGRLGVPSVSVKIAPPYGRDLPAYAETWDAKAGSLQNWDGLVWSAELEEATFRLAAAKLEDFAVDPDARRRYVERYLGFDDTRSSERVLDVIERDAALRRSPSKG